MMCGIHVAFDVPCTSLDGATASLKHSRLGLPLPAYEAEPLKVVMCAGELGLSDEKSNRIAPDNETRNNACVFGVGCLLRHLVVHPRSRLDLGFSPLSSVCRTA